MRLTTKGRFAVTALMDLALRGEEGPIALASIAERQSISLSYLEQLFGKLRRHKLVESVRGPGGGYCIAKPLEKLSVADIIRAVDEQLDATQCGGEENCHEAHRCMTHDLWSTVNSKMFEYLASVSMADLVGREKQKAAARGEAVMLDTRPLGPHPRRGSQKVAAVA